MFGLCVGELIHSGTKVSLSEGCGKEASRRMEYRITAGVKGHRQTADRRGRKVKASRAEKEALVQAGLGAQRGPGATWVACSAVFDQHSKSRMVITP